MNEVKTLKLQKPATGVVRTLYILYAYLTNIIFLKITSQTNKKKNYKVQCSYTMILTNKTVKGNIFNQQFISPLSTLSFLSTTKENPQDCFKHHGTLVQKMNSKLTCHLLHADNKCKNVSKQCAA